MGMYQNLKEIAKRKNITISKIEHDLNYYRGTLSKWDKSEPSHNRLVEVANYLNVSTSEITGKIENDMYSEAQALHLLKAMQDATTMEILVEIEKLPIGNRKALLVYLKSLNELLNK